MNFESQVSSSGESKVLNLDQNPVFSYLFDEKDNLLMVGLVGPNKKEVSIETTAEYLLYLGFGIPFFEEELSLKFFEEVRTFPIWVSWVSQVKDAYQTDILALGNKPIIDALLSQVNPLTPDSGLKDKNARVKEGEIKAADLLIDGEIKSGLQVSQSGLNEFQVANTYRRRVHGFLYKTEFVNSADEKKVIHASVGSSSSIIPDKELEIATVNGVSGFSSTVYDYLVGDTEKSFRVTSSSVSIPLLEAEKEAKWQLRIIGPGKGTNGSKNSIESSKMVKLQLSTLMLDFILPLISDAIAVKGAVSKGSEGAKGAEEVWEALITAVLGYVDKMPEVKSNLDNGLYGEAVEDFFTIGYNQFGSIFFEDLVEIAAETIYNSLPKDFARPSLENFKKSASRMVKIIAVTDLVLKGSDYIRRIHNIADADNLEIWEIMAKEVEINLEPRDLTVDINTNKKLTAFVKSSIADGQVLEYQWHTSGKFGYLKDDKGHEGKDFSSSSPEVFYYCTKEGDKTPTSSTDSVKVSIYMKVGQEKIKVGSDYAIVKISDKQIFSLNYEPYVGVSTFIKPAPQVTEYSVGPPTFVAKFAPVPGAKGYRFTNVRQDGTKESTIYKNAEALFDEESGALKYSLVAKIVIITQIINPEEIPVYKAELLKILEDLKWRFDHLEVEVVK